MKKHLIISLSIILFNINLYSQKDSTILFPRDELNYTHLRNDSSKQIKIFSASRSSKFIEDLPVTIYVVTRDEIIKNEYVTLVDVLKSVPGIRVSQPGSPDEGETFLMRGLIGNYYTKILINNLPIQPSVVTGMPIGAQLPIRQAERIEIIFGPASAIYGADATIGVINIITKTSESNSWAQADISRGQYGYSYLNFSIGGKLGINKNIMQYNFYGNQMNLDDMNVKNKHELIYKPLSYLDQSFLEKPFFQTPDKSYKPSELTEEILQKNNYPLSEIFKIIPPNYEGTLTQPVMNNLPYSSYMVGLDFQFKGFKFSFLNMYRKIHSSIGKSTFIQKYNNPNNFFGEYMQRYSLGYDYTYEKFSSSTNLSYLSFRLDNSSSRGVTYNIVDNVFFYQASDDLLFEQLCTYSPTNDMEFLGGISYQYSGNLPLTNELNKPFDINYYSAYCTEKVFTDAKFGDFGYNPFVFSNFAYFGQFFYTFNKFTFIAGIRHDVSSNYKNATNPRLALCYKANNKTSFRISYGTAHKAPTGSFKYASVATTDHKQTDSIAYEIVPNPNLSPEKFSSYEFGFKHSFSKNIQIDISAYSNLINNLILYTFIAVDKKKYPLSVYENQITRTPINSDIAESQLLGIQSVLRINNILEPYHINTELSFNIGRGRESLPNDSGKVSFVRMLPKYMFQWKISFYPFKKFYLNFENTLLSSWIRRAANSVTFAENSYSKIDGYYTLDINGSYHFNKNFRCFFKIINVFDKAYGGIDVYGMDVDLKYNPQFGRNIRLGITYTLE